MSCWSRIHFTEIVYLCYAKGCIPSFNVLLCLELVINCVVSGWVVVVCKPILVFSLGQAEQFLINPRVSWLNLMILIHSHLITKVAMDDLSISFLSIGSLILFSCRYLFHCFSRQTIMAHSIIRRCENHICEYGLSCLGHQG